MRFSEFMNEWLYGKDGYYTNLKEIGKTGDFYTAVSTTPLFGAAIANYLFNLINQNQLSKNTALVEIGAHQGYLMADMIRWLYTKDENLLNSMRFIIIEKKELVLKAQKDYFEKNFGNIVKIEYIKDIKELKLDEAFFISNEIFDAFACELYKDKKIAIINDFKIDWIDAPKNFIEFAKKHHLKTGEIAIGYEEFAKDIIDAAKKFEFLSFDYGEKYIRNDFSIRLYTKHKTYPLFDKELNLKDHFKKSDITYDVNFTHIIDSFINIGAKLKYYETQARALVRFGIIEILSQYHQFASTTAYLDQANKVKTLIAPTLMGDRFKLIHFSKNHS